MQKETFEKVKNLCNEVRTEIVTEGEETREEAKIAFKLMKDLVAMTAILSGEDAETQCQEFVDSGFGVLDIEEEKE